MFLVDCEADNSLLIVENEDMICDLKTVRIGNLVSFIYKKNKCKGEVLMQSDDENILRQKLRGLIKIKPPNNKISQATSEVKGRRQTVKKRSYSPSDYDKKKETKKLKNSAKTEQKSCRKRKTQKSTSPETSSDDSTETLETEDNNEKKKINGNDSDVKKSLSLEISSNESDDDLNGKFQRSSSRNSTSPHESTTTESARSRKLEKIDNAATETSAILKNLESIVAEANSSLDDDTHLYGPNCDGMVHLKNGIYVKSIILGTAIRTAKQATHIARQLLEGVVKRDILVRCTLTGKPARGKSDNTILALHAKAKDAIIDYAIDYANHNKWQPAPDRKQVEKAIGQKLTELKLQHNKNNEK